jgi:GT2 family glycosyltransferase
VGIGVVPSINQPEKLDRLLRAIELAAQPLLAENVVPLVYVIDSRTELVRPSSSLAVIPVAAPSTVGFAQAMNQLMGIAFASHSTRWFVCLKADSLLHRTSLLHLIRFAAKFPESLIEARQFPEEHPKVYHRTTFDTGWASSSCLLIPRHIVHAVGSFDPGFGAGLEDVDFSWRVRCAGFSIKVCPLALFGQAMLHRSPNPENEKNLYLSGRYLAHKWGHASFREWTEQEMVKNGFFASCQEMPTLPPCHLRVPAGHETTIDFNHQFSFSPTRW